MKAVTDEIWKAIANNDTSYDNAFFYAIKTTGIFCKPSCKSKLPNKNNVHIFQKANDAIARGFRPCKRCKPTDERLPDQTWVDHIIEFIDKHYAETLTLQTIADSCHGSPHHLHRTFKRMKGITPAEYIQQRRMEQAILSLTETNKTVREIACASGIPNTPYFVTLFKKVTGFTPNEYRQMTRVAPPSAGSVRSGAARGADEPF